MNNVIPELKIHHIALVAKDFEETVAFYEKLGFVRYTGWGEGNNRIVLMDMGNGSYLEIFASSPDATEGNGRYVHIAFAVNDVKSAYDKAIALGAKEKIAPKVVSLESSPKKITINCGFVFGLNGEQLEFFKEL